MSGQIIRVIIGAAGLLMQVTLASAADTKLLSTVAFKNVLEELTPKLQIASGRNVAITYGLAAQLVQRIQSGEAVDVAILTRSGIDTLAKEGKIAPSSAATLASTSMALAVKSGAAKPDISSPEAFKRTLLSAKSIATGNPAAGGASSVYFAKLLERMGIAEEMKAKTKFAPPGKFAADLVASGDAELGVMQTSELVTGTDLVGVFPGDLNLVTAFGIGLGAAAADTSAANALIRFLKSPEAAAVYKAKGMYPN